MELTYQGREQSEIVERWQVYYFTRCAKFYSNLWMTRAIRVSAHFHLSFCGRIWVQDSILLLTESLVDWKRNIRKLSFHWIGTLNCSLALGIPTNQKTASSKSIAHANSLTMHE